MAARLVDLQRQLRRPEDEGGQPARTRVGGQQGNRLAGDPLGVGGNLGAQDVLPSSRTLIAPEGVRKRPLLDLAASDGQRDDTSACLDDLLLDQCALGVAKDLPVALADE